MQLGGSSRFDVPLFKDRSLQEEIAENGYCVLQGCLSKQAVQDLLEGYEKLIDFVGDLPQRFCPSGRFDSVEARNYARQCIDRIVPNELNGLFLNDAACFQGGTFLIKPPGPGTELNPHQDSSHVDESRFFSVYAWIPLHDTTVDNGCLHVIPKSHIIGNNFRSLNVPWPFMEYESRLWDKMIPLEMKAGDICFFEGSTFHASPQNNTSTTRVAINYFIHPSLSRFTHYYRDHLTPESFVERYHVSIDYFYNEDFEARPPKANFSGLQHNGFLKMPDSDIQAIIDRL